MEKILTKEQKLYLDDDMYLPISYRGYVAQQPIFLGAGNHSVLQLENICRQFKEYCHQQNVIKQNAMKHIIELKFGIDPAPTSK